MNAELLLARGDDIVGTAQPARRRGARLQEVFPDRLQVEHRVEGRDLVDPDGRHVEELRDMIHRGARQPVFVLALGEVEEREHRAGLTARRILRDDPLCRLEVLRRELEMRGLCDRSSVVMVAHRSISPKTMSSEPMIATTSASMWPRDRKSSPCRKAKPGARILQR